MNIATDDLYESFHYSMCMSKYGTSTDSLWQFEKQNVSMLVMTVSLLNMNHKNIIIPFLAHHLSTSRCTYNAVDID